MTTAGRRERDTCPVLVSALECSNAVVKNCCWTCKGPSMPIRYSLGYSTSKPPMGLKGKEYYEYNAESSKTRGTVEHFVANPCSFEIANLDLRDMSRTFRCYLLCDEGCRSTRQRLRLVTCLSQKRELTKRPDTAEVRPCSDGLPSRSAIRQIYVTVQSASHRWRPIRTGPKR